MYGSKNLISFFFHFVSIKICKGFLTLFTIPMNAFFRNGFVCKRVWGREKVKIRMGIKKKNITNFAYCYFFGEQVKKMNKT